MNTAEEAPKRPWLMPYRYGGGRHRPSPPNIRRRELLLEKKRRAVARRSLLTFVESTHGRWITGYHHRIIAEALERVAAGTCKRLMIFAPPRHAKTELVTKRFLAWMMGRHPEKQFISCAYNDDLSADFGRAIRDITRSAEYRRIFPGFSIAADANAKQRWVTNAGGTFTAAGIGGTLTGFGGEICVLDDPFKSRAEADSKRNRNKVWNWYSSTFMTRLQPDAAVILMCTRWHHDDLAGRLLRKMRDGSGEDWELIVLPAIIDEGLPTERALCEEWMPLRELRHKRDKVHTERDWQALFMQSPSNEDGSYIKRHWFKRRWEQLPKHLRLYIASDYAVKEEEDETDEDGPDWTEHGVFGVDEDGYIYVLDWWYGRTTSDVWIEELLNLVSRWKPRYGVPHYIGEGGVIQLAVEPLLKTAMRNRRLYFPTEWLPSIHDKSTRARGFQGTASLRRIIFGNGPLHERVINQCVDFGTINKDDAFDTMGLLCRFLDQLHGASNPDSDARNEDEHRSTDYGNRRRRNDGRTYRTG